MKKFFYLLAALVGTILLLAITNPTTQRLRSKRPADEKVTIERKNYYLYSLYIENGPDVVDSYQYKYIGILGTLIVYYSAVS